MAVFYRHVSKSPNYVRRFGVYPGLRLLFQVERSVPDKAKAIRRYALPNYPAPVYLRENASDHSVFWQCLVKEQYDFFQFPQSRRLTAAYRKAVGNGIRPLIVDCGGNIGLASVWLATHCPEAVIYAVEPDNDNLELLMMNTSCFGPRVTALRGGIWQDTGALRIINPGSGSAAFRVAASGEQSNDSIRAYTMDEICALAGVDHPFIVKLDIEGAQAKLFERNTDWVRHTHLIMIELDDWQMPWEGTSRTFFSCISQYAFDYILAGEILFCFRDFDAMP